MLALSVKQPWAALLVSGCKTIEVRRWPTARRGRVLIHAARRADERSEAWEKVPRELLPLVRLRGGIIGAGTLTGCVTYRTLDAFAADEGRHRIAPDWFEGPFLYGFLFANLSVLPFRRCRGRMGFFHVEAEPRSEGPSLFPL
jgi:hypothetical protein